MSYLSPTSTCFSNFPLARLWSTACVQFRPDRLLLICLKRFSASTRAKFHDPFKKSDHKRFEFRGTEIVYQCLRRKRFSSMNSLEDSAGTAEVSEANLVGISRLSKRHIRAAQCQRSSPSSPALLLRRLGPAPVANCCSFSPSPPHSRRAEYLKPFPGGMRASGSPFRWFVLISFIRPLRGNQHSASVFFDCADNTQLCSGISLSNFRD